MATISTFTALTDIAEDVPEIVALVNAVETSLTAHKGESAVDAGLDVVGDCLPAIKALVKAVEKQLAPAA